VRARERRVGRREGRGGRRVGKRRCGRRSPGEKRRKEEGLGRRRFGLRVVGRLKEEKEEFFGDGGLE
jgi:hypothetical protein